MSGSRRKKSTASVASTVASKYRYSWTRHFAVDPNVAGEIIRKAGTPENVLAQASHPANPLHSCFEWDDTKAAREYRLVQCRTMVNSLRIEIVDVSQKPKHITAFVKTADRVSYVAVPEADKDALTAAELNCYRQMKRFQQRWKDLQFAQSVVGAIQLITQQVNRNAGKGKSKRSSSGKGHGGSASRPSP